MWRCATRNSNYFGLHHPKIGAELTLHTETTEQSLQKYNKKVHKWAKVSFSYSALCFIFNICFGFSYLCGNWNVYMNACTASL